MNVLPTCDNLIRRRVEVMPICSFCNHQNETVLHALMDCAFARTCWISSSLGFVGHCSSFLNWLELVFTRSSKEMCNLIAMICWKLWMRRNDKFWNNKTCTMSHVLNSAGHYLFQWQATRMQSIFYDDGSNQGCHGAVCWEKPLPGWLKCNVDAATFMAQGKVSYGGIIRNSEGAFMAACCAFVVGCFGARDAEALGVREVLSWIKCRQLSCIVVEMDCFQVFKAFTENYSCPNGYGLILDDCRALSHSIGDVRFSFVRRSANTAAHAAARVGRSLSGFGEWSHVPPLWLNPYLYVISS
ncbi:hypothetical protein AB3S75_013441 [Citrus x aurantiifolia]